MSRQESQPGAGFSLIELLVAVALLLIVLGMLLVGLTAVTETISGGTRQSEQHLRFQAVERVVRQDLSSLVVRPAWPVFVGDPDAGVPGTDQLVLAFLRHRLDAGVTTDTEWVQYWREAHPDEERLEVWVRYVAPADDRQTRSGPWWDSLDRSAMEGEVLIDEGIESDWQVWNDQGPVLGLESNRVRLVELSWSATSEPLPPVFDPSSSRLARLRQEEGSWTVFRVRPVVPPPPEAVP